MTVYTFHFVENINYDSSTPLSRSLIIRPKGEPLPVPGRCTLSLNWEYEPGPTPKEKTFKPMLTFGIEWSEMRSSVKLQSATITCVHRDPRAVLTRKLAGVVMEKGGSGRVTFGTIKIGKKTRSGEMDVIVSVDLEECMLPFNSVLDLHSSTSNDVQFWFPNEGITLYANSAILKAASPYFITKLSSSFDEITSSAPTKVKGEEDNEHEEKHEENHEEEDSGMGNWVDSDGEEDEITATSTHSGTPSPLPNSTNMPYKLLITETKSKTYLATLHWMLFGRIQFASLTSLQYSRSLDKLPCSPKSIYQLASFLKIETLKLRALNNFKSQIEAFNVAVEMYSDFSYANKEIRDVTTDFACRNWEEVKKSEGMKNLMKEMREQGKTHVQMLVGAELLGKLSEI